MTPAERTAKIAELRAEADRLERERKRNWPEKVELLMVFKRPDVTPEFDVGAGHRFVVCLRGGEKRLVSIDDGSLRSAESLFGVSGDEGFEYLGRLRDLLTIKTPDAPEPTGAELVGKVCDHRDYESDEWVSSNHKVESYDPSKSLPYLSSSGLHWKFARLAKEQP